MTALITTFLIVGFFYMTWVLFKSRKKLVVFETYPGFLIGIFMLILFWPMWLTWKTFSQNKA